MDITFKDNVDIEIYQNNQEGWLAAIDLQFVTFACFLVLQL